jgi:hypothetical protein
MQEENPYQPPDAPLATPEAARGARRSWFRFRYIPATLCFFYGGIGVAALLFMIAMFVLLALDAGASRINLGATALVVTAGLFYFTMWLWTGWLWVKGRWLYATLLVLTLLGVGLAIDRVFKADRQHGNPLLRRVVQDK